MSERDARTYEELMAEYQEMLANANDLTREDMEAIDALKESHPNVYWNIRIWTRNTYLDEKYPAQRMEAAVNERVAAALGLAKEAAETGYEEWARDSTCHEIGCGCITVHMNARIDAITPQSAIDAQEKRDARVRYEEAKWWAEFAGYDLNSPESQWEEYGSKDVMERIRRLEAAAR